MGQYDWFSVGKCLFTNKFGANLCIATCLVSICYRGHLLLMRVMAYPYIGGVSHTDFDIDEIINSADRKLFSQITQPRHCLHHLIPPKTSTRCPYSLRKRQHNYQLSHVEYSQYKNSFITRCLFNFR